ncbi:MFS transporter [Aquibium sp. A9E412]|uniref:MFS transporter n=1 Tax=Aquibium sp. A9E412 TaxID=2976767 RepID=UPI0025B14159|nr:MFS transporter [Aquibium sp. A9E412]MDN2565985.1 MFS transporter [Aquibium sp. A9E412]
MRLPTRRLMLYAAPALPLAALTLPLYIIVPTFYAETLGVPLAAVGAALLAVRVFDALNDPLIGALADRWRPAFGRRRTAFALSLPLTALAAWMLFRPPDGAGAGYLALWGAVLSLGYTATLLPFAAWGAELAGDYRERARVAAWREGFTLVGSLAAIAIPFSVGLQRAEGAGDGLGLLGLVVALALPLAGALTLAAVPEPREHSVARIGFRAGLAHMRGNGPFLRLMAAYLVNGLANGIPATLFLYFVSDRLALPELRGPLLFLYFLSGVAGVPLALAAAGRLGKHRAWALAMLAACAVFVWVPAIPPGGLAAFAAVCVLTGLALGFDLSLPAAIQADVIDVDTEASGEQRSGVYFAAWSLVTKLSLALGVGIAFPLIGLAGFAAGAGADNPPGALLALAATYAWLPVALKLVAVALMWRFPLDRAAQTRLRARIEARGRA